MTRALRGDRNKLEVKRRLRLEMTPAERVLWEKLRARQFLGLKFRRQHGIGRFVADFFCPSRKLVIEVDGEIHDDPNQAFHNIERTKYFEELSHPFPINPRLRTPSLLRRGLGEVFPDPLPLNPVHLLMRPRQT